ncbi:GtrA family protein [Romboutsia sp. 1001216sp1]|uniref:GtrA family protein n=1 Tax=Romboutsia sp. 1001216sp1 TaxID=2986997 RepID=UPI00232FB795|nr:GtrA family protein [Romboutsia sp. 1001216sp1]MDB8804741.1 GtrA family protein [Romboutsia sp. 1001216sp1]MDB8806335.1 GtrA family protein [Romboutsia sp. 1001216sp1]MDB8810387.1 GtrA family protein [Romboutsia sp. 1001216sp1]MDB8817545.1 GtrA family protein [Romboutsia sp. 1001216sp1]MDB8818584.1 GtrA family protein [Romboutsia sp. 1001216sp1]
MDILKKYRESIMYLVFGGLTVGVNIATYIGLTRIIELNYMVANIIAWIVAVIFAYITNKFFVFESNNTELKFLIKEFTSFVSCRLLSGVMEMILMYVMIDTMGINDFITKIFTNILVIVLNYVLSKVIIFKKKAS